MRVQTPVTDGADRCGCRHQLQTGQTDAGVDTSYRRGRQMRVQTPADVNNNKKQRIHKRRRAVSLLTWNKLSTDCINASSVNMFKNKVDTYLSRADYT